MSIPQLSQHRVNIHILSPIHIGTEQELDPFSYIIKNKTLHLIDVLKWIESNPDKENISRILDSDNFSNLRSFIAEKFDLPEAVVCSIPVDNKSLLNSYQKAIQDRDPRNQVLISPMTRNSASMTAFIPGSSVKGAIRTAIANRFVKKAGVTSKDRHIGKSSYNQKIFGSINKDPMRWLKLSDIPLEKTGTAIVESREYPLNPDKSITPKGNMEVALSLCHTGKSFVYPLRLSMAPFELHGERIDPQFLIEALYEFYVPKYEQEYEKFYRSERAKKIRTGIAIMNNVIAELRSNETLIRIGHFSHVECITLDDVRNPRTRRGKDGRPLPWGKTRTLANGISPFGWAKIEFLDFETKPRNEREWPFSLEKIETTAHQDKFQPEPIGSLATIFNNTEAKEVKRLDKPEEKVQIKTEPLIEKLHRELSLIKSIDMGRIGTVIQKIDQLESAAEKGQIAAAIRDKIGPKALKKHKRRDYLLELIELTEE